MTNNVEKLQVFPTPTDLTFNVSDVFMQGDLQWRVMPRQGPCSRARVSGSFSFLVLCMVHVAKQLALC